MAAWKELGGPARIIGTAIGQAVDAAGTHDRVAYESAVADLVALPAEQAGQVLGALVRLLLEDQHPDGMETDDIRLVLARCYRAAAGWLPLERLDVHTLAAALASALGIHEPGVTYEEITGPPVADDWSSRPIGGQPVKEASTPSPVPTAAAYVWHAPLLIADLLAAGGRPLGRYLDTAFTEIARAETMELP
jgi:hypothetical protein